MDAEALVAWMEEHDWQNTELAEALNVHSVTVSKWRSGTLPIGTVYVLALGNPKMTSRRERNRRVRLREQGEARGRQKVAVA